MDIGSILMLVAVVLGVAVFVGGPFIHSPRARAAAHRLDTPQDHARSALLAERDRVLTALQELDFDHTLGKIPEDDYPAQRMALLQSGADVLRKLDEMEPATGRTSAESRLEAAVAARRADARRDNAPAAAPADELEAQIAARRRAREEKSAGFCPKCGKPVQKSDAFCPRCGATL